MGGSLYLLGNDVLLFLFFSFYFILGLYPVLDKFINLACVLADELQKK